MKLRHNAMTNPVVQRQRAVEWQLPFGVILPFVRMLAFRVHRACSRGALRGGSRASESLALGQRSFRQRACTHRGRDLTRQFRRRKRHAPLPLSAATQESRQNSALRSEASVTGSKLHRCGSHHAPCRPAATAACLTRARCVLESGVRSRQLAV